MSTIVPLCRLQILTEVCYRVAQLHEGTTYSQIKSIYIDIKGLRKVGQG